MDVINGLELVTFGETMALLVPDQGQELEYSANLRQLFGGAESNVAIGVSRLGHQVGWFGHLGKDPFGRAILKRIRGEGVDVSQAALVSDTPTGFMLRENVLGKTSVYYYRRYSAASRMQPIDLNESYIAKAKILHITGITPALSPNCRETAYAAIQLAQKNGVKVCFDPNLRLKLWGAEEAAAVLLEMAKEADYFLPGLEELERLYGTKDLNEIVQLLSELKAVTIIKGANNQTLVVENGIITAEVPYYPVDKVVDSIGAGDGFCAGFIAGLLREFEYGQAVKLGNLVGSLVVQAEGDWEGLPAWEQVESILQHKTHVER